MTDTTTPDAETTEKPRVRRGPRAVGERSENKRLTGDERTVKAKELARAYNRDRVSIRALAAKHNLSYGLVYTLLREQNITLRGRGGARSAR